MQVATRQINDYKNNVDDDNKDIDDNDNDGNHDDDDNDDSVNVDSGHFNQLHWGRPQSDLIFVIFSSQRFSPHRFFSIQIENKNGINFDKTP